MQSAYLHIWPDNTERGIGQSIRHTGFRYIKALFDQVRDEAEAVKENTEDTADHVEGMCPENGHHKRFKKLLRGLLH